MYSHVMVSSVGRGLESVFGALSGHMIGVAKP